jgi:hypothetical protein
MKRSVWAIALLALFATALGLVAPAQAQSPYSVTTDGCTITINLSDPSAFPITYKIGPVEGNWPYDAQASHCRASQRPCLPAARIWFKLMAGYVSAPS